jgi:hypothetical protein
MLKNCKSTIKTALRMAEEPPMPVFSVIKKEAVAIMQQPLFSCID